MFSLVSFWLIIYLMDVKLQGIFECLQWLRIVKWRYRFCFQENECLFFGCDVCDVGAVMSN